MTERNRGRRFLPAIAWMALIFALSSKSHYTAPGGFSVDALSVLIHLFLYSVLAALLFFALRGATGGRLRTFLIVVTLTTLYGISDELHQAFVPERNASLFDVAVDFCGACLATATLIVLTSRRWIERMS